MNPAELSLSTIAPTITNNVGGKTIAAQAAALGNSSSKIERVNLEPIYLQLKTALGEHWGEYKLALAEFVKGRLNQNELAWALQPVLSSTPGDKAPVSTLHLHNTLLAALYANSIRDPPPTDVAPWVVATDKPASTSKSAGAGAVTNDKFEERQKNEVMGMAPRDRKRIKGLKEVGKPVNDPFHEMQLYANELVVKPSSQTQQQAEPQSATGAGPSAATATLARSNHDIEIRRRYAQTLASEALEFPSVVEMQNRIEPICYEEGLAGGVQQGALQSVAELVEQAAEVWVKEMLGSLLTHARSNGVGSEGIKTNKFRRQLRKEEDDLERGILQRNAAGLVPIEIEMQAKREPLDMQDLRLSLKLSDNYLEDDHFLDETIMLNHYPDIESFPLDLRVNGGPVLTNGVKRSSTAPPDPDAMDIDGLDGGSFKGVEQKDHENNPERAARGRYGQGGFDNWDGNPYAGPGQQPGRRGARSLVPAQKIQGRGAQELLALVTEGDIFAGDGGQAVQTDDGLDAKPDWGDDPFGLKNVEQPFQSGPVSTQRPRKSATPKPAAGRDSAAAETNAERQLARRRESTQEPQNRKSSAQPKPKPKPAAVMEDGIAEKDIERPPTDRRASTQEPQNRQKSAKPRPANDQGDRSAKMDVERPPTSRRESIQDLPNRKSAKPKATANKKAVLPEKNTETPSASRRESTQESQNRKKTAQPKVTVPDTSAEQPSTSGQGRTQNLQDLKTSAKPKTAVDRANALAETSAERQESTQRTQSRQTNAPAKTTSQAIALTLARIQAQAPTPAAAPAPTDEEGITVVPRGQTKRKKSFASNVGDNDEAATPPSKKKSKALSFATSSPASTDPDLANYTPRKIKRKRSLGSNFASDDAPPPPPSPPKAKTSNDEEEDAPTPPSQKKLKAPSQASADPDFSNYTPRKPKRKRSLGSNFASDDGVLPPPPPSPPKAKTPRRKKRVMESVDGDEETPPPKRKKANPRKKKKDEDADIEDAKEKSPPAVPLTNPYLPQGQMGGDRPQTETQKKSAGTPAPDMPARKPYQARQPSKDGQPAFVPRKSSANEPTGDSSLAPEDLFAPSNQRRSISQTPPVWNTGRAPSAQPMPSRQPTPADLRASISREFGQAYHTLPAAVTNVNQQDFDRTALFQAKHRAQEASGTEAVSIGLPVNFGGGSGYGPQSGRAGMPAIAIPADNQRAQSVHPGSQLQASAPVRGNPEDWDAQFEVWANSAEGTAALSGVPVNEVPSQTEQPPRMASMGYDRVNQYAEQLARMTAKTEARQSRERTMSAAGPAHTAISAPTLPANDRANSVQPTQDGAPDGHPSQDYLTALDESIQKNRNYARPVQNTTSQLDVQGLMQEAYQRQRGLSASSNASAHSTVSQGSHQRQHSGSTAPNMTPSRMQANSPLRQQSVDPRRAPARMPAQSPMPHPSPAPVVPRMGGNNISSFDGAEDFAVQPQQQYVQGYQPNPMAGHQNAYPNGMGANPLNSAPQMYQHPGMGMPAQAPGMVRSTSNGYPQRMGVPVQAPGMVRSVSNGNLQDSMQRRPRSTSIQSTMPPPASPMQAASRSLDQARRDSFVRTQQGQPSPQLLGQYPPQQTQQQSLSMSPPRMSVQGSPMTMPNGLPQTQADQPLQPFVPGQPAQYHPQRTPTPGFQSAPPQHQNPSTNSFDQHTPPRNTNPQPNPFTPSPHHQQQGTPRFVPAQGAPPPFMGSPSPFA
ncbi:hypothetical protein PRZ48_010380 [Zasmidium cellare]|uniref:Uncharacterized protein n=1 Tax=Zasmidium cellare TaxID=395010 RepID=A0ABR0E8G7_ZASCE|nr:hypothetical protein PRZ48_010380 [Zasmidium cellare]